LVTSPPTTSCIARQNPLEIAGGKWPKRQVSETREILNMVLCSQTKKGIATQGKMPISNNVPCKLATFSTGFTAAQVQKTVLSHVSFSAIIFTNNKSFIFDKNGGVLARIVQGFFSPCLNSWHLLKHKIFPHRFATSVSPKIMASPFDYCHLSEKHFLNEKSSCFAIGRVF